MKIFFGKMWLPGSPRGPRKILWVLGAGLLFAFANPSQAAISCPITNNDLCDWVATPQGAWTFQTISSGIRPPPGATHYAVASASVQAFAELESQTMTLIQPTTLTFSFVQTAFSSSGDTMQLWILNADQSSQQIWSTAQSSFSWRPQSVSLAPRENFRLRFRLKIGNRGGTAAVANVVIANENEVLVPPVPTTTTTTPTTTTTTQAPSTSDRFLSCTFRAGMCGWNNDAGNVAPWEIVVGANTGFGYPGQPDASDDEFYLFAIGDPNYDRTAARLVSPPFIFSGSSEIRFWYRFGVSDSTSKLSLVVNNQNYENGYVLALDSDQSGTWLEAWATLNTEGAIEIFVLAEMEERETVSLDEILWTGDATSMPQTLETTTGTTATSTASTEVVPPETTTEALLLDEVISCEFSEDFCGWSPETSDAFQWRRTENISASPNSIQSPAGHGPTFLFAEGATLSTEEPARLVSRSVTLANRAVLRFWEYSTAPLGAGAYVALIFADSTERRISYDSVVPGQWRQRVVVIDEKQTHSMVIGAGVSSVRRFGIDGIQYIPEGEVTYGDTFTPQTTTVTTTVPTTTTIRPAVTDDQISCSWANGLCGWRNHPSSQGNWVRTENAGVDNLPIYAANFLEDRTMLAFRGTNASDVDQALLQSPTFNNPGRRNITFWYLKRGTGDAVNHIALRVASDDTQPTGVNIWRENGGISAEWSEATVLIEQTGTISLIFYCGARSYTVCAIDEVQLQDEFQLEFVTTSAAPVSSTSNPISENTITEATCNFDSGLCNNWHDVGDITWDLAVANSSSSIDGPQSGAGYIESVLTFGGPEYAAILRTAVFGSGSNFTHGRVTFWINHGTWSSRYRLSVHAVSVVASSDQVIYEDPADVTDRWVQESADFCINGRGYLYFRAQHSYLESTIGLDEVVTVRLEAPSESAVCPEVTEAPPTGSTSTQIPDVTIDPHPPYCTWSEYDTGSCSFDQAICPGWFTPSTGLPFVFQDGSSGQGSFVIPDNEDHSGYARTNCNVSDSQGGSLTSMLETPIIEVAAGETYHGRVRFWYFFTNLRDENRYLRVALSTATSSVGIWTVNQGQAARWNRVDIEFDAPSNFSLTFVVQHNNCDTPVAIDNVVLQQGVCTPPPVTCDFEDGSMCTWTSSTWEVVNGTQGTDGYAISSDEGFLVVSSSDLADLSEPAVLTSILLPPVETSFAFAYRAFGHGVASLELFAEVDDQRYLLWHTGNAMRDWSVAFIPLCFNEPAQLIFEARFFSPGFFIGLDHLILNGEGSSAVIPTSACPALDNHTTPAPITTPSTTITASRITTSTTPGTTTTEAPVIIPVPAWTGTTSCTFENNDLCGWRNVDLENTTGLTWRPVQAVIVESAGTTPLHEGRYFAAVQTEGNGTVAYLLSPTIDRTGAVLLEFYYTASGRGASGLSLFTVTMDALPASATWSTSPASRPGMWTKAVVQLRFPALVSRRQILLSAQFVMKNSYIAIDAIRLNGEDGNVVYPEATTTPAAPMKIVESATCSFDNGLCPDWFDSWQLSGRWQEGNDTTFSPQSPQADVRLFTDTNVCRATIVVPQFHYGWVGRNERQSVRRCYYVTTRGKAVVSHHGRGYMYAQHNTNFASAIDPVAELWTGILPRDYNSRLEGEISFWYRISGAGNNYPLQSSGSLDVNVGHPSATGLIQGVNIWTITQQNQMPLWKKATVRYCIQSESAIVFRASLTNGTIVSLDEVVTTWDDKSPGQCPAAFLPLNCDFQTETDYCGWQSDDDFSGWRIVVGPHYDIEADENEGYLAVDSNNEWTSNANTRTAVRSIKLDSLHTIFMFSYHAYGESIESLTLYAATEKNRVALWELPDNNHTGWHVAQVEICIDERFQLVFEARFVPNNTVGFLPSGPTHYIGLDHFIALVDEDLNANMTCNATVIDPRPPGPAVVVPEGTCDFEGGFCSGWTSPTHFQWKPSVNHSLAVEAMIGNGFAFVENEGIVSSERDFFAELHSPMITIGNSSQISGTITFWYYMGLGSATMELYAYSPDEDWWIDQSDQNTLWKVTHTISHNEERNWRGASVTFCFDRPMALVFRVRPLATFRLAALDGVVTEAREENDACPPPQPDRHDITCNFEEGRCGWQAFALDDSIEWQRVSGDALQGGHYLQTVADDPFNSTSIAMLIGSHISGHVAYKSRFTFWYRLPFGETRYLFLGMLPGYGDGYTVWQSPSEAVNSWRLVSLVLCENPGGQLVFVTNSAEAELDDLHLWGDTEGSENVPAVEEFCANPVLTCGFELGWCAWRPDFYEQFRFEIKQGSFWGNSNISSIDGPSEGSMFAFAYANDRENGSADGVARLTSRSEIRLSGATEFSFWYHARGYGIDYLRLTKTKLGSAGLQQTVLWETSGTEIGWQQAVVQLCDESEFLLDFSVAFRFPDYVVGLDEFVLQNESSLAGQLPNDTFTCPGTPVTTITCSFINDTCGWTNDGLGLDFIRRPMPWNATVLTAQSPSVMPQDLLIARISSRRVTSAMVSPQKFFFAYEIEGRLKYIRVISREEASEQVLWEGDVTRSEDFASFVVCPRVGSSFVIEAWFDQPNTTLDISFIDYDGESLDEEHEPLTDAVCPFVSCNFEHGTCGWSNQQNVPRLERWVRSKELLEEEDQFEGTPDGFWHMETYRNFTNSYPISRLVSGCFQITRSTTFDFWHHSYGRNIRYLKVKLSRNDLPAGQEITLWEHTGTTGIWMRPTIQITKTNADSYQLIFEAAFSGAGGIVAIDKTKLLNEGSLMPIGLELTCPALSTVFGSFGYPTSNTLSCSFDRDFCAWQTEWNGFEIVGEMEAFAPPTGRGFAHTIADFASIRSPTIALKQKTQMFFYYFAHTDLASATLYAEFAGGERRILWRLTELNNDIRARWVPVRIALCLEGQFRLAFHVDLIRWAQYGFGLDEVIVSAESSSISTTGPTGFTCEPPAVPTNSITCDGSASQTSFCGWQTTVTNGTDVQIGSIFDSSDNDTQHNNVLYVTPSGSTAAEGNLVAEITSSVVSVQADADSGLLSFWYLMRGDGTRLEVLDGDGVQYMALINRPEHQDQWHFASRTIPIEAETVQLKFLVKFAKNAERRVRRDVDSDQLVALDDIWLGTEEGVCNTTDYRPISCDFEEDEICGWTSESGWNVSTGVSGTGSYAINETEGYLVLNGDTAGTTDAHIYRSDAISPRHTVFQFAYRAFGHGIGYLRVFMEIGSNRYLLWDTTNSLREWSVAQAEVCSEHPFRIVFEGRFTEPGFVIGLDHLYLAAECDPNVDLEGIELTCPPLDLHTTAPPVTNPSTTPTTPPTTTAAPILLPEPWSGNVSCTFERDDQPDICGWKNFFGDTTASGWGVSSSVGELTSAHSGSHFLTADVSRNPVLSRIASADFLYLYDSNGTINVDLEFYYQTKGRGVSGVAIYAATNNSFPARASWAVGPGTPGQWNRARASFAVSAGERLQLILETRFFFKDSWIAVDDIILAEENGQTVGPTETTTTEEYLAIVEAATCSFDYGLCEGWHSIGWHENETSSADVTPHSGHGFVSAEQDSDWSELFSAPVAFVPHSEPISMNVTFWYIRNRGTELQLRTMEPGLAGENDHDLLILWTIPANALDTLQWEYAEITVCYERSGNETKILIFHANHDIEGSFAAVDEVVSHRTKESCVTPSESPSLSTINCDFELYDMCGWTSDNLLASWKPVRGTQGSDGYAIESEEGYVVVSSSSMINLTQPAVLTSSVHAAANTTFVFAYRAFGHGIASLELFAEVANQKYLLWHTGDSMRDWSVGAVHLCFNDPFKLIWEARFFSRGFHIALDHLLLEGENTTGIIPDGICEALNNHTTPAPITTPTTTTTTTQSTTTTTEALIPLPMPAWEGKLSCSFEDNNLCDWRNLDVENITGGLTWEVVDSIGSGSLAFNASNNGNAFAAASTISQNGTIARLLSPNVAQNGPALLEFYYVASGRGASGLNLYTVTGDFLPVRAVWSTSPGSQPRRWTRAVVEISFPVSSSRRQVLLSAQFIMRNSWIGIDDIVLNGEDGQVVTSLPTTPTTPPHLPIIDRGSCSFDYGLCPDWETWDLLGMDGVEASWTASIDNQTDFAAVSGRGFMYAIVPSGNDTTHGTQLTSPEFYEFQQVGRATSGRATFWYRHGPGRTPLALFSTLYLADTLPGRMEIWNSDLEDLDSDRWHFVSEPFCVRNGGFLLFIATKSPTSSYVALDEVISYREDGHCEECPDAWIVAGNLTCSFDDGMCDDWHGFPNTYGFVVHNEPFGALAPQSGSGYAVSECSFNDLTNSSDDSRSLLSTGLYFGERHGQVRVRVSLWYAVDFKATASDYTILRLESAPGASLMESLDVVNNTRWTFYQTEFVQRFDQYDFFTIAFMAESENCAASVAIDSVVTEIATPAPCPENVNDTVTCDFESGNLCGWSASGSGSLWQVSSGQAGSGPYAITHVPQGTRFLSIDSDDLPVVSQPAAIATAMLEPMTGSLSFTYRAFGPGIAYLAVFVRHNDDERYLLWDTNNAGRNWSEAEVTLCINERFQLVFEARFLDRGYVIGLDDIHLESNGPPSNCTELFPHTTQGITDAPFITTTASQPSLPSIPLPAPWYGPASCSFEDGTLCDWRNLDLTNVTDTADWSVVQRIGTAASALTSAYRGRYFAAAVAAENRTVARLMSPDVHTVYFHQRFHIEFYYRASGRGSAGVSAYVATGNFLPESAEWSVGPGSVTQWNRAVFSYSLEDVSINRCQIILEARFFLRNSWMAIDEILLEGEDGSSIAPVLTSTTPAPVRVVEEATCSFDYGLCDDWHTHGLLMWQAGNASYSTVQAHSGRGFVFVEYDSVYSQYERHAELESGVIQPQIRAMHLNGEISFWYLFEVGTATLEVYTRIPGETWLDEAHENTIWSVTHTVTVYNQRIWRRASVRYCIDDAKRIVFRLTPSSRFFSLAALDEVITTWDPVTDETPLDCSDLQTNHDITCDFEARPPGNALCGWENEPGNSLEWAREFSQQAHGGDLFIDTRQIFSNNASSSSLARFVSSHANQHAPSRTQLTFYYRVAIPGRIYLKLGIRIFDEEFEIWRYRSTGPSLVWKEAKITLCESAGYQLVFETNGRNVGLDDITLLGETTDLEGVPDLTCPSPVLSCDFEDGLCGWRTEQEQPFHFRRIRESANTIPAAPGNSDWFVAAFAEDRPEGAETDTAKLFSRGSISLRRETRFRFWYHAERPGTGFLKLTKSRSTWYGPEDIVLWEDNGFIGTGWQRVDVALCDENAFTLTFEAGFSNSTGIIGLDEISLLDESTISGQLPDDTYTCPGSPITTISCSFEESNNTCGWRNDFEFRWDWYGESVGANQSAIASAADGYGYLAAVSNLRPEGNSVARITSRPFTSAIPNNTQFSFWYSMKGSGARYLRLILREPSSDQVVWERVHNEGFTWMQANVTICTRPGFHLVFETAFNVPDQVVGLDGFVLHGESDSSLALPGRCPIVSCNFERDMCGWRDTHHPTSPGRRWVRSDELIEEYDHYEDTPDGFWHIETTGSVSGAESISRVITECITLSQATTIDFWYHFYGSDITFLRLASQNGDQETTFWEQLTPIDTWTRVYVQVPETSDFRFILEAGFSDTNAVVAVDKVKLLNEAELVTSSSACGELPTTVHTTPATTSLAPPTTTSRTTLRPLVPSNTLSCSFEYGPCKWINSGFEFANPATNDPGLQFGQYLTASRQSTLRVNGLWLKKATMLTFYYRASDNLEGFFVETFKGDQAERHYQIRSEQIGLTYGRWTRVRVPLCITGTFDLQFLAAVKYDSGSEFDLDEIIFNDELGSFTTEATTLTCPTESAPSSGNTLTCDTLTAESTKLCGWTTRDDSAVDVAVGRIPGLVGEPASREYALLVSPKDNTTASSAVIESITVQATGTTGYFTFWYTMGGPGTSAQVFVGEQSYGTLPAPSQNGRLTTASFMLPRVASALKISFRVSFAVPENVRLVRQEDVQRLEAGNAMFALLETWYSNEPGFVPDAQIDDGSVSPVPSESTVRPSTAATPSTPRPGPPGPTPRSGLSDDNIIIVSVCSVAGALILLGAVLGFLHYRSKRREKKAQYMEDIPIAEMRLPRASTVNSQPPAYTSTPASKTGSVVYKPRRFDEDSDRL